MEHTGDMSSVIRRATPADIGQLASLVDSRQLAGPSAERLAEAIASDIVVVAERDGRLRAAAMIMTDPTFRDSPWWSLRPGVLGDVEVEQQRVCLVELVLAADDRGDRRSALRAAHEALRAARIDHDVFVAATLTAPIEDTSPPGLLTALGFTDVGSVEHDVLGEVRLQLPPLQFGPAAWTPDLVDATPIALDDRQVGELIDRARSVSDTDDLIEIEPVDMPRLRPLFDHLRHDLLHGPGFALVSGLPTDDLSPLTSAAAFMIVGSALGRPRMQNANGDLLGHVRDVGLASSDPNVRIYQTSERQTFHTDSTDVVGLCCLHPAGQGGDSLLVSALAIYNEMVATRPDLAARLFEPVATDRRGEIPEGADPWFAIPPFTWFGDRLAVIYQRQYIDSAQRFDDVDRHDPHLIEALDRFDQLAEQLSIRMRLDTGDMQFVNNHALLHDRTAFRNVGPGPDRHLLRLWLSMPDDQPLDPVYAQRYGSVEIGNRGGIALSGVTPRVTI